MRTFDTPLDVIDVLQSPASSRELDGEAAAIDLMVQAFADSAPRPTTTSTKRRPGPLRVGVLIAAGVVGFGGIAAAGPGGLDPLGLGSSDEEVVPTVDESVVTTLEDPAGVGTAEPADPPVVEPPAAPADAPIAAPVVEVTDATVVEPGIEPVPGPIGEAGDFTTPIADAPLTPAPQDVPSGADAPIAPTTPLFADNPATAFNEERCKPGPHGATVSAVARREPGFEDLDVTEAAQSDCGKPTLRPYGTPEASPPPSDDDAPSGVPPAPAPDVTDTPGPPAHANGGNGGGNANQGNPDKGRDGNGSGGRGND